VNLNSPIYINFLQTSRIVPRKGLSHTVRRIVLIGCGALRRVQTNRSTCR